MNNNILSQLQNLVNEVNSSNSTNDKIKALAKYKDNELVKKALLYVYSPYKQFNVTSKTILQRSKAVAGQLSIIECYTEIFELLDSLSSRYITGNDALDAVVWFIANNSEYNDLILNMIDKDLKIRMNAKNINKAIPGLIPEFNVALCNVYKDRADKVDFEKDNWLSSRKLDGCRCVAIVDENGKCTCWSRQGKTLDTLGKIEDEISSLGLKNVVFDGECCIVDENGDEHFDWIMKEIKRKNHTIDHPMYQVFDMMTLDEFNMIDESPVFSDRVSWLNDFFKYHPNLRYMKPVKQTPVKSLEHFNELFNEAKSNDWEGLVIRKDVPYEGKRSNNMLKVKDFSDAEYVVEDVEFGPFRVIVDGKEVEENVLTNIIITHKGNKVSVGSGFALDERRMYKEHPEKILGKTVTVQYFEETVNKDGEYSLRFPTIKCVYENGRNI